MPKRKGLLCFNGCIEVWSLDVERGTEPSLEVLMCSERGKVEVGEAKAQALISFQSIIVMKCLSSTGANPLEFKF